MHSSRARVVQVWHRDDIPRSIAHQGTGFSLVRFWVPELCEYRGRAVYLDSDMIVVDDVAKLVQLPFGGAAVLRPENQSAVLALDCAALRGWSVKSALARMRAAGTDAKTVPNRLDIDPAVVVAKRIPPEWNVLERWRPGTKLLHFTSVPTQPWTRPGHECGSFWYDALRVAVAHGDLQLSDVDEDIRLGHIHPHVGKEARRS